ncbi:gliding motility-associated C-terminal domain-containing protein [Adhaeribacter sp. BT258]|uniref:Gliding motility-associated C-terminal domain-containing protein n=1 Tax=Adhaeribacter terrigena TaxID=2793070 RepID=A0ABS1BY46_9BACT|nr:gliding motility-associated C-terminal domain-containing protein [Adhaeribacter terrigena]MBK0401963.1 gliding motility-associated C-terminal domain-containing protein [Adhaeribacter terrigena]
MNLRPTLLSILLLLPVFIQPVMAQRQTDNWFFGNQASLEFSSAKPTSFFSSAMVTPEGSATISDKQGNLLFYTDGKTIWNRLHLPMANGTGLNGHNSSTQSALIVPQPGNDSVFFVFTSDQSIAGNSANGVQYSLVNINANNSMGEVLASSKNIPLTGAGPVSEKLAGVHHFNNQDIWVIAHRFPVAGTQEFLAYQVTATGLVTTPVISSMPSLPSVSASGYLKASPLGNKLAATFTDKGIQYFDFDNKTGLVSNLQTIPNLLPRPNFNSYYGAEFSPDGQKLYFTRKDNPNNMQVWQYNLAGGPTAAVMLINTTISNGLGSFMAMQLARNGKIYIARHNTALLSEIADPNNLGIACNLKAASLFPNNLLVSGSMHGFGFPNFIQTYFAPPRFNYSGICAESPTVFSIINTPSSDSVSWDFGDPASMGNNTSKRPQPSHIYSQPGTYNVKLTIYSQGFASVFERQVIILNNPKVNLGPDTIICEGQPYNLISRFPHSPFNERFRWSTGDTSAAITVTKAGIYWLELNNGQCTTRDSIRITTKPVPTVNLGEDFFTCGSATLTLDAGNPGATYLWQPGGQTTQTITVNATAAYSVTVTANGCSTTDTKNVSIMNVPGMDLGSDVTTCDGETVTLRSNIPATTPASFIWSDNSRGREMKVTKTGKYWATITRGSCSFTDTVQVTFNYCPPPPQPFIPNIITANGDNLNDKLTSIHLPEGAYNVRIFNRWGMQVFEKKDYRNEWPENKISNGNYFYIFENQQTGKQFKGWVEVVE